MKDEEYLQYKEDVQNTLKMATILRSLNEPKRKRVEEKRAELERTRARRIPKNLLPVIGTVATTVPTVAPLTLSDDIAVTK